MNGLRDLITPAHPLFHMPGFFGYLSLDSKLLCVNKTGLDWIGCDNEEDAYGLSYENLNCKASEDAELFIHQDSLVKVNNKPIYFIGCYRYANNNWRIIYGKKYLIKGSDDTQSCIVSQFDDVTNHQLIDKSRFLIKANERFTAKLPNIQFCYLLDDYSNKSEKLSKREQECLFFLIRGHSNKSIAKILALSPRTVEDYVEHIKYKLDCHSRDELIEKAIVKGYINLLPASLLK